MPAPAATVRQDPAGILLEDGYRSLITFSLDPDIDIWELGVKPPDLSAGGSIDITTMHNDRWRTMAGRALLTLGESSVRFLYDPACYTQFLAIMGENQTITQTFSDGSTIAYFGIPDNLSFDEMVEGEPPSGTLTIIPTNRDPVSKDEFGPTVTSVAGT
jgi:hypothetical protein